MDIGVFDHLDRRDAPLADFYESRLRLLEKYDAAGFYSYHLAEHHATPLGLAPSPGIFIAAATQRTRRIRLGHGVVLGYYAQEHEGIHEGVDVITHMRSESGADDQALCGLLGMFGLTGEVAFQDAGTLSGGEKTKLALAQLVAGRKNLLLLDEPTNNLDPPSRAAIAEALQGWPGAMVIVSHDTEFVEALAPQRILLMPDGELDLWDDDLLELVALA